MANDLELAADLIHKNGIICGDDFFSFRYPQLTVATYKFLVDRQPGFQIFTSSGESVGAAGFLEIREA